MEFRVAEACTPVGQSLGEGNDDSSGTGEAIRRIPIARKHEIALVTAFNVHIWQWRNENNRPGGDLATVMHRARRGHELLFRHKRDALRNVAICTIASGTTLRSFARSNEFRSRVDNPTCVFSRLTRRRNLQRKEYRTCTRPFIYTHRGMTSIVPPADTSTCHMPRRLTS